MDTTQSIGAPIETPAAPTTPPAAPAPSINPVQTPVTPSLSTPVSDPVNEARVRHFQSEADRLRAEADKKAQEAERARQEAETARREADALRATNASILEDAHRTAAAALAQVEEIKKQREMDQAKALKANILLEEGYRALAPYAGFVQPTTDEQELRRQLDALKAARDADLAATSKATTPLAPQPPAFSAAQPMQPARPQPQAPANSGGTSVPEQIAAMMKQAAEQLSNRQITIIDYEQQMQQIRELAAQDARRQMGITS